MIYSRLTHERGKIFREGIEIAWESMPDEAGRSSRGKKKSAPLLFTFYYFNECKDGEA